MNIYLLELESIGLITSESEVKYDSDQSNVLAPSQPSWIEQIKVSAGMNYNKARKQVRNRQGESKAQSSVGSESKQIWTWGKNININIIGRRQGIGPRLVQTTHSASPVISNTKDIDNVNSLANAGGAFLLPPLLSLISKSRLVIAIN